MNEVIRNCFKAIAYCHFHPDDKKKKGLMDALILRAWNLQYPRVWFNNPNKDIVIGDMTRWEIAYALKDVIDIRDCPWYNEL